MKLKVFFDTNVILDVLLGDRPNSSASYFLFEVVKEGLMEGVVTTQSLLDAAYIVGKMRAESRGAIRQQILNLMKFLNVDAPNSFDLKEACLSQGDFEDEVQLAVALDRYCHYIVTGDEKFRAYHSGDTRIRFITPSELVSLMRED